MTITGPRNPPPATRPQRVSPSAVQRGLLETPSPAKKRKGRHLGERHVIAIAAGDTDTWSTLGELREDR
jgi:hypothetical protein